MTPSRETSSLKAVFRQQGFTPAKAELWARFLQHSLSVLRIAADTLVQQNHWDSFKSKRGALGKARPIKGTSATKRIPIEDAITSELIAIGTELRISVPKNHFLREHEVIFTPEALVYSESRAGRHSRKSDIHIQSLTNADAPELRIEAKPVTSISDIRKRYLGDDGIGCFFTTDSPYTKGPLGAMLAYTISENQQSFGKEVNDALASFEPSPLQIIDVTIDDSSKVVTASSHARTALELPSITILHLEMIFPPDIRDELAKPSL